MSLTPEDLIDMKVNLNLLRYFYPEVINTLGRYANTPESLEEQIMILGEKIGKVAGGVWKKRYKKIIDVIKDIRKMLGASSLKLKPFKDRIEVTDKKCPLCIEAVETTNIHYCIIISGFVQGFFKEYLNRIEFPYKEIIAKTVKSRSSGDEICKHILSFTST